MKGQLTVWDCIGETNPNKEIEMPKFDRTILNGNTLDNNMNKLKYYLVTFKQLVAGGWKKKICVYHGWWHSLDGWNYDNKNIESWEEIKYQKGDKYRWM